LSAPRLATHVLVSALIRQAEAAGGSAAVLGRGDRDAGGILLVIAERGQPMVLLERQFDPVADRLGWSRIDGSHVGDPESLAQYLVRRRGSDPDLWVLELDTADAERFTARLAAAD
jgi:hypothetical protein